MHTSPRGVLCSCVHDSPHRPLPIRIMDGFLWVCLLGVGLQCSSSKCARLPMTLTNQKNADFVSAKTLLKFRDPVGDPGRLTLTTAEPLNSTGCQTNQNQRKMQRKLKVQIYEGGTSPFRYNNVSYLQHSHSGDDGDRLLECAALCEWPTLLGWYGSQPALPSQPDPQGASPFQF